MHIQHKTLYVDGMTCGSCETRISKAVLGLPGVIKAEAQLRGTKVDVVYDDTIISLQSISAVISTLGYAVRERKGAATIVALGIGLLLSAAYLVASSRGLFNAIPSIDSSIGYAMLFVVGLLTSIHCIAMCGGIALSQSIGRLDTLTKMEGRSARFADTLQRAKPGLSYNAGRVVSYTIIGGIVGGLGSVLDFSPIAKGIIAGLAGLFMVILGLKMLGVLRLPSSLGRLIPAKLRDTGARLSSALKSKGPFAVGMLNGLMPCGPLQTMQLYALGTGSVLAGAFSMFLFSLGTVPFMALFGVTATFLPRKFMPAMLKASAVLVMFLGVVTFGRAASLSGIPLPSLTQGQAPSDGSSGSFDSSRISNDVPVVEVAGGSGLRATISGGVQSITTVFTANNYAAFTVQAGLPLKWTIRIKAEDLNGCNNTMIVPAYGIKKRLKPGDNLVEFTPAKEGIIAYSCWMGMIRSRITVVRSLASNASGPESPSGTQDLLTQSTASAGSSCAGTTNPAYADGQVPIDVIGIPVLKGGIQEITVTVNSQGYSPSAIVLQKGIKAIIRFKPEALDFCNGTVMFPEYNGGLDLAKGELATPAIPITDDFTFQCSMGMLHGYVKVVDDLAKVDLSKIKEEIGAYRASNSGIGGCCGSGATASAAP